MKAMKIVIIGAGVSGLTTAYCLREKYPSSFITILADKVGEKTTSSIAGALWEWQPAVCGFFEELPEEINQRDNKWAIASYRKFYQLKEQLNSGIYWRRVNFYLTKDTALERKKIKELCKEIIGFEGNSESIFKKNRIDKHKNNFVGAYSYLTPMIDTSVYLNWLMNHFLNHGGICKWDHLSNIQEVIKKYNPDIIVNCAGLGSRNLASDRQCLPVQGGWLLYNNLTLNEHPLIREAHCTTIQENSDGGNFIFIVPRGTDKLIVGGFAKPNDWSTELDNLKTSEILSVPLFKRIIESNSRLVPWLSKIKPISHRVGLRPFRKKGAKLEVDNGYEVPVIHNYGHGGSGVTLSWGCAESVSDLTEETRQHLETRQALSLQTTSGNNSVHDQREEMALRERYKSHL